MLSRLKSFLGGTPASDSSQSPATGINFPVDDVVPASDTLWQGTLGESLEIRADATILLMPDRALPTLAPEGYSGKVASMAFTVPGMSWPVILIDRAFRLRGTTK